MHLTDLHIHEIVKVRGLPRDARDRAIFTNGRSYDFDANFAHGYEDARIFVWRSTDGRATDPTTRTARSHPRTARNHRICAARARRERGLPVLACHRPTQELMRPGAS